MLILVALPHSQPRLDLQSTDRISPTGDGLRRLSLAAGLESTAAKTSGGSEWVCIQRVSEEPYGSDGGCIVRVFGVWMV